MSIRIYDPQTQRDPLPLHLRGRTAHRDRVGAAPGARASPRTSCAPARRSSINEDIDEASRRYGSFTMPGTQDEKSALFVPLVIGEQARGLINLIEHGARARLQRVRRPAAADARQQHERRARERAALRRDAAAVQGKRAARRRARDHQQRPAGRSPPSSTSRRSSTWSATSCARCSAPATSASAGYDPRDRPAFTTCTSTSMACGRSCLAPPPAPGGAWQRMSCERARRS